MGLLDKIDLGRKRPRPVGQSLEKGRDPARRSKRRRNLLVKSGILVILVLLTLAAFPREEIYRYTVQEGDEWRRETLVAPFSFSIYKDPETIEQERREVSARTAPIFEAVSDVQESLVENRDTVARQVDRLLEAYASYRFHRMRGQPVEAAQDSLRYLAMRRNARLKIPAEQWRLLERAYVERMPGLSTTSRESQEGPFLHEELLRRAWEIAADVVNIGVLDVPRDSVQTETVRIRNDEESTQTERERDALFGLNEAYEYAATEFEKEYGENDPRASLGTAFFRSIFLPSLSFQRGATYREIEAKRARISPTRGKVNEGDVIVREGQTITAEIKRRLTSLERERNVRGGDSILWRVLLGQFLVVLATYVIFFLYLFLLRRQIFDTNKLVTLVVLLFAGIVGLFAVAIRIQPAAMYGVPVAIAPVLLTVLFDSRVGLFGAITLALIGGQILNYDFEFTFATLFATTLGVFSVRDIKNRSQFFRSAALVFVGYVVSIFSTYVLYGLPFGRFVEMELWIVGVNSFLLILAYPLLWVFERAFDITTDLSLLELSDTNRPLLKELSLRAPGTFQHSLQVANLAEAAADAIGANALLTRVGALYHDIGKMLKPEYFVENQRPNDNPHNQLKPRMSALIIASHVKEGLEMGRQYNLPQRVLDFIPMHHGTTRIEYFYRKALEQQKESEPQILESEFRYPGPRPAAKETGILMLADSVEAASRSLSDPTHKRLETLIEMIFKARTEDGQLDNTDLTFRDLNQIKETFLNLLLGIYHVRVKYPGQEEEPRKAPEIGRRLPPEGVETTPDVPEDAIREIRDEGVIGTMEQGVRDREAREQAATQMREQLDEETREAPAGKDGAEEDGVPPPEPSTGDAPIIGNAERPAGNGAASPEPEPEEPSKPNET